MAESVMACSACLRSMSRLSLSQRPSLTTAALLRTGQTQTRIQTRQTYRTIASAAATASSPTASRPQASSAKSAEAAAEDPSDESGKDSKTRDKLQRAVKTQLKYLSDPWAIGQYVQGALQKDRYDEALLLTQMASRTYELQVAWNHLIAYALEKQQLRNALKVLNDMKKRGQRPSVQTYTVLFRGLAKSEHPKVAVAEAIKHYNALLRDSRLEANSIHLNAVLNVCSRAGDLDSMFSIVDTVNESNRAPTPYTYSTIINALRFNAMREIKDLPEEQRDAYIRTAIDRSKAIWEEAIGLWRRGRLAIDEDMVCSMGRMLLMAPDRVDKREVLDLIEQTMNIPNISKPSTTSTSSPKALSVAQKSGLGYVEPGANTLSLVLTVVASSRLATSGIKYWNLLVLERGVQPDMDSWMRVFGMLKVAKASAHAADMLVHIPSQYINPRFYLMAMEACIRDNINQNAIKNANRVLDSMRQRLDMPSPHVMRLFLRVSLVSHFHLRARSDAGDLAGAKRDYGLQIAAALSRLIEPFFKLHRHYFERAAPKSEKAEAQLYNDKREVVALARTMYSAFNKIVQQEMLPEADLAKYRQTGARINRVITNFFGSREEAEPNLSRSKGRGTAVEDMSSYEDDTQGLHEWDTTKAGQPRQPRRSYDSEYTRGDRRWRDEERPARRRNFFS